MMVQEVTTGKTGGFFFFFFFECPGWDFRKHLGTLNIHLLHPLLLSIFFFSGVQPKTIPDLGQGSRGGRMSGEQSETWRASRTLGDHLDHPFPLPDRRRPGLKEGLTQDHTVRSFSNAVTNCTTNLVASKNQFFCITVLQVISQVWVFLEENQGISRLSFCLESLGEDGFPANLSCWQHAVPVAVGPRSPVPRWLSPGGHSLLLQGRCTPWLIASFLCLQRKQRRVRSFSCHISLTLLPSSSHLGTRVISLGPLGGPR